MSDGERTERIDALALARLRGETLTDEENRELDAFYTALDAAEVLKALYARLDAGRKDGSK